MSGAKDDLMTLQEAAEALTLDIPTIEKYIETRDLKAVVYPHVADGIRLRRESVERLKQLLKRPRSQ